MKNQMVKERVMDELVKTSTMNELMVDSAPIAKKSIKKRFVVIIQTKGRTGGGAALLVETFRNAGGFYPF